MIRFFGLSLINKNLNEKTKKEMTAGLAFNVSIYGYLILLNQCPSKLYVLKIMRDYAPRLVKFLQKIFAISETIEMIRYVV